MNEHPIIFSTPMVQAILKGRKTQTRRIIKDIHPDSQNIILQGFEKIDKITFLEPDQFDKPENEKLASQVSCPYGKTGNLLWVRETWQHTKCLNINFEDENYGYVYKADGQPWEDYERWTWKPSIYMPKIAARIWIKLTNVRVEQLHQITEEDAKAEGVPKERILGASDSPSNPLTYKYGFFNIWNNIHGYASWLENPWVWVIEFEVISTNGKPA